MRSSAHHGLLGLALCGAIAIAPLVTSPAAMAAPNTTSGTVSFPSIKQSDVTLTLSQPQTFGPGTSATITATLKNNSSDGAVLPEGLIHGFAKGGWSVSPDNITTGALVAGDSQTFSFKVAAPFDLGSEPGSLDVTFATTDPDSPVRLEQSVSLPVDNVGGATAVKLGATITGHANEDRDLTKNPYHVGDKVGYTFAVTSTGTVAQNIAPVSGNFDDEHFLSGAGNCHFSNLQPSLSYQCTAAVHTITQADLDAGYFTPTASFQASAPDQKPQTISFTGDQVKVTAETKPTETTVTTTTETTTSEAPKPSDTPSSSEAPTTSESSKPDSDHQKPSGSHHFNFLGLLALLTGIFGFLQIIRSLMGLR